MSPKQKTTRRSATPVYPPRASAAGRRSAHAKASHAPAGLRRRYITLGIIGVGVLIAILVIILSVEQRNVATAPTPAAGNAQSVEANAAALQDRLRQNPTDVDAMISLGDTYYDAKRYTEAIPWYERALAQVPANTNVRTDLGTAYLNSGNSDKAKEQWNLVLQQDPNKVETHYNLGILYSNLNPPDNDSAAKEWETVIKIAPNSEQAKVAQQKLKDLGKR